MNKYVYFVLASLIPLVLTCCIPEQWQGIEAVSIGSENGGKPRWIQALYNVSYDAKAMKMFLVGSVMVDGASINEAILLDYNMKNQYVVVNGNCTMSKLTTEFPTRCPSSSKMVMSTFMGAGMEKLMVDIYGDVENDTTEYIYLTKDCIPITYYTKSTDQVMDVNYMGITPGIKNMTIFNVPIQCKHAPIVSTAVNHAVHPTILPRAVPFA